jgi:transposase
VAESALYSEENLQKLADTPIKWITRVPGTVREAHTALAQADPQTMAVRNEDDRSREWTSNDGGVPQRWVLIYSEPRHIQAPRTVDKHLLTQGIKEGKAFQKLCRIAFACEAEAQQALTTLQHGLQATDLHESPLRPLPRSSKRGRPSQDAQAGQVVYQLNGALASALPARQALIDQHRCVILATNELETTRLLPQELLDGYKGQGHAEHGCRFLKDPQFFTASFFLKKALST